MGANAIVKRPEEVPAGGERASDEERKDDDERRTELAAGTGIRVNPAKWLHAPKALCRRASRLNGPEADAHPAQHPAMAWEDVPDLT